MKKEEKEQLEGEKRNEENRQSEEKRRKERRAARDKSLTWREIQFSSLNISSRPGGGYSSDQATPTPQRGSVPLMLFSAVK